MDIKGIIVLIGAMVLEIKNIRAPAFVGQSISSKQLFCLS